MKCKVYKTMNKKRTRSLPKTDPLNSNGGAVYMTNQAAVPFSSSSTGCTGCSATPTTLEYLATATVTPATTTTAMMTTTKFSIPMKDMNIADRVSDGRIMQQQQQQQQQQQRLLNHNDNFRCSCCIDKLLRFLPATTTNSQTRMSSTPDLPVLLHNHCHQNPCCCRHRYRRRRRRIGCCYRYYNTKLQQLLVLLWIVVSLFHSITNITSATAWMINPPPPPPTTTNIRFWNSCDIKKCALQSRINIHQWTCTLPLFDLKQRRHYNTISAIFMSSSNSFATSDVIIPNEYERYTGSNNDNNGDSNDSRNTAAFESTSTTNGHMPEPIHQNVTNDDDPSFNINDADSFWVRSQDDEVLNMEDIDNGNYDDDDIPRLTENGGYSHTQASRAKISAANKGKVPWNKGLNRTDDVKARIAAGVRAKNRERHLLKLQEIGITEDEYEEQKRKERSEKEAERRARRTENGGYRPTEETKRKISEILKQKFAAGEIKARPISPTHVRRGFTHSDETRKKISESLRKRWSSDPVYRAKMIDVSNRVNTKAEVRQKISESLRNKWQSDDTFRNDMMTKIAARKRRVADPITGTYEIIHHDESHRAKISAAMKAKWQDTEYREKTLQSLASRRNIADRNTTSTSSSNKPRVQPRTPKKPGVTKSTKMVTDTLPREATTVPQRKVRNTNDTTIPISHDDNNEQRELKPLAPKKQVTKVDNDAVLLRPVQPLTAPHKKVNKIAIVPAATSDTSHRVGENVMHENGKSSTLNSNNKEGFADIVTPKRTAFASDISLDVHDIVLDVQPDISVSKKEPKSSSASSSSGNVELLKTERRDLYDLLYGDDEDGDKEGDYNIVEDDDDDSKSVAHKDDDYDESTLTGTTSPTLASIFARLEDDNLDTFDPYGLDNF